MGSAVPYTADQLAPQFQKVLYKGGCDGIFLQPDPIGFEAGDVNLYSYVWQNPVNWIDSWGLEMLRPSSDPYIFGRRGSRIYPGGPVGSYMEDHVTHMHQTAIIHDSCVDSLKNLGVPDIIANYPTMIPAYGAATVYDNITDYSRPQQNFTIFQVNW